jgi:predicted GH43/DUF377 family glycosyl hydrolase
MTQNNEPTGVFEWQLSDERNAERYAHFRYDEERYRGGFPASGSIDETQAARLPVWAIGPFTKHPANPVLAPSPDGWDVGRMGGGVHNGAMIVAGGKFHYIYRGEMPAPPSGYFNWVDGGFDYVCDIGLAVSDDGVHFVKDTDHTPFFRRGKDARYSWEDPDVVYHDGVYYQFLNRWDWSEVANPAISGAYLATSTDLLHWEKRGLLFPRATAIHRNPCILQTPHNEPVRANGRFVMYLNDGWMAYSDDLLHWESECIPQEKRWPGGEGCKAVTHLPGADPDRIVLFTGGHHSGHFYAIGEVLLSQADPAKPLAWLPRPVLYAEERYPWEDGLSAEAPHKPISYFRDTVFFTGLTLHRDRWWLYYGGSEYYTCLATAEAVAS